MGTVIICVSMLFVTIGLFLMHEDKQEKKISLKSILSKVNFEKQEELFEGTHFKIPLSKYEKFRNIIGLGGVICGILLANKFMIIFMVAIYLLLVPQKTLGKIMLPFFYIDSKVREKDKADKDSELTDMLLLLNNMLVQFEESPKGADYVVEKLLLEAKLTKTAFLKFLNEMRLGRKEYADKVFAEEIGTILAIEIGRILVKMDLVDPVLLRNNLISIQSSIKAEERTRKERRIEWQSYLLLIPVIFTIMVEFANFLVVFHIATAIESGNNFFN